ncbi:hypothetical protein [Dyadobacter frigoris]|uniref:T9SS type A sorting domain-containing protein n=1 Tax=Dyadobacter frigoris TaxID=2576211 RepID=A0A4U6D7T2_9BACT|nr:hypothetical protein [Dyadobacter frigoris]TKT92595.1 hypothetical protein FDK13_07170 [Dyadobacter frigoris]
MKQVLNLANFILLAFFCTVISESRAQNQIRITTNVLPPYSPYIQDYPGTGNRVQVFISNLSGKTLSVRLLGKLEGDNGVVIQTSRNYRPLRPLELRPTDVNRMLTRTELEGLFDLAQIEVQGMNKNELYRGLPLPEGNYQLCVQAFDNATIHPLSAEFPMGCSGLIPVRIVEPPILISPFDNEEVISKTPQIQLFSWSAPVGILPNQVEYILRIVELPGTDVNPNVYIDAMVLPKTGLEVRNLKTATFLYGPSQPPLQYGKRYAWRVQALPTSQKLNFMNEGKSPVQVFTYGLITTPENLEYITMKVPNGGRSRKPAKIEIGNNNPLEFAWELDKEFETKLRKVYNVPASQKSLLDYVSALSYKIQVRTSPARPTDKPVFDRQVRTPHLQLEKTALPSAMVHGKSYEVSVELTGVSDLMRKQAQLFDEHLSSKPQSFSLVAKDKGNADDTLTISGILAYKYPGEAGPAHILPNTKVVLSKIETGNYILTVAHGNSDASGRYNIKVLKSTLHGPDLLQTFTRCVVDPVNPFIQPNTSAGSYQTSNENTFQIARTEQGTYHVEGITWLASGYSLDLIARQTYKNWPGAADAKLADQYIVLYRKKGLLEYYDKLRLPVEGQVEKQAKTDLTYSTNQGIVNNQLNSNIINSQLPFSGSGSGTGNTPSAVALKPASQNLTSTGPPTLSGSSIVTSSVVSIISETETLSTRNELQEKIKNEVIAAGYQFIGISQLKANGNTYSTTFERLVYADKSYDNYRVYCPGCGQKPDDGQAIIFLHPKEKLSTLIARIEKDTFNIETTEPPTMTFKGKLAYKFADPGQDGAMVQPLGNTQVTLQVVYKNNETGKVSTFGSNLSKEITDFHTEFSSVLDTKVTKPDGSFEFSVKMTKPMILGMLAKSKGSSGELGDKPTIYTRSIRVVIDNPYYASPVEEFGTGEEQMSPQGLHDFGTIIGKVKSYNLRVQVKSDTTGISQILVQKAGIKENLFGMRVSVLRDLQQKIPTPGANKRPPSDEGFGEHTIIKIKDHSYKTIGTGKSDVNGKITFPRMVMANGVNDTYFIATESNVDGLNNYQLVSLKRIIVNEAWADVYTTTPTAAEKAISEKAGKTKQNGALVNCRQTVKFRCPTAGLNAYSTSSTYYLDSPADAESIKSYMSDPKCQKIYGNDCEQANDYWLGQKLSDAPINQKVLLTGNVFPATQPGIDIGLGLVTANETVFADQYKYDASDIVQRYLQPGAPTVNVRVVDKSDPTKGIKNALVSLSYDPEDGSIGNTNKMTDANGWITSPFVLKPGKNAKVKIIADGYYYDANPPTIKIPGSAPFSKYYLNVGDVMLGQNSYYPTVLMQPNTHITGRAIDYDSKTDQDNKTKTVSAQNVLKAGTGLNGQISNAKPSKIQPNVSVIAQTNNTQENTKPELGLGQTMEAYVQADDGYLFKTAFKNDMWAFDMDAPSSADTLKIIPVNLSYFNEQRLIRTELPKPASLSGGKFSINAGDIDIYQRDHRVTFKIFEKGSGKEVAGAIVKLFGKEESGFVFGPSNQQGVVETRFKNISVENLYVEISAPGYVTQTKSITNEESKTSATKIVLLEPAVTVNGIVVVKSAQGVDVLLEGALVFVSAGTNTPLKYSTISKKDGSFSLDVDKNLSNCTIEATFSPTGSEKQGLAVTYIGARSDQVIPQGKGNSLKLTLTTFSQFSVQSIWGFPVTIEKLDPKTLKVTGEVDLTDTGLGPFGIMDKNTKVRFKDVVFKANPDRPQEGIPANETVELETGVLNDLVYHPTANIAVQNIKYNIRLTSLDDVQKAGKLKIIRTPGTSKGKIMAQAQVIDNSFNFSANLLSYEKGQFFIYDPNASGQPGNKPAVTAFDSEKNTIKWTDFGIAQKDGNPMKLKLLAFDATSKLEGSRLIGDEIHLNPVMTCKIKDANPSELIVNIGDLVIKNNTVDTKTGQTPLTFPLAGKWTVEVRDWKLDYKKGGFYATKGVIKTGKLDVPIKEFNLRSDFFKLDAVPENLELAGVAKLELGGKAFFGYDTQTGSDMKGHWSLVLVPEGTSPAAKLPANSLPGLTAAMEFQTVSLLDNGQDVVTFGSGNKKFRYFNIIDVRPTTIETGPDWFAFDSGMSSGIPNAPQDVSMRFIYSKPKDATEIKLKTVIPGKFKFETSGYLNFEAGQDVAKNDEQSTAIYFGDGVMAIRGRVEEPEKLLINDVLLIHTKDFTHITHNRNLDLHEKTNLAKFVTDSDDFTNPKNDTKYYNEGGGFKQLGMTLEGSSKLSQLYCHQSVTGTQWGLMNFSGLPQGFKMWEETEKNRLSFTAFGEVTANNEEIGLDGIDTPLGGLSLVYDRKLSRFTGTIQLPPMPIPPTMTFSGGIAQVRVDGNGFYFVASGKLENVPLLVPITMSAGLMLGYYASGDLSDAASVLFANSHRKSLPCSFDKGFKGVYATGEIPSPFPEFNSELSIPAVGGYKVGLDAYVDAYAYAVYQGKGAFNFGAGLGIGAHAYAYGSILSLSAGGEVHVNGGIETGLTLDLKAKRIDLSLSANVGAGFSVVLEEELTSIKHSGSADFCIKVGAKGSYTIGQLPTISPSFEPSFTKCGSQCSVTEK